MARQRMPRPEPNIPKQRPHGVVCYWEFQPSPEDCEWVLKESFAIDGDGRCLTTPSTGGGDREEWHKWMNERVYFLENDLTKLKNLLRFRDEGEWFTREQLVAKGVSEDIIERLDDDWKAIMSRAVTVWTLEDGVQLLDFHPPEWAKWLAVGAYEKLRAVPEFWSLLEKGYDLYLGTADAARQYLFREYK